MNTTTSVVLTGALVALGQWTNDKQVTVKMVVGVGLVALFLAAMSEVNQPLAQQFGVLILVGAVFIYGPDVMKGLGVA